MGDRTFPLGLGPCEWLYLQAQVGFFRLCGENGWQLCISREQLWKCFSGSLFAGQLIHFVDSFNGSGVPDAEELCEAPVALGTPTMSPPPLLRDLE